MRRRGARRAGYGAPSHVGGAGLGKHSQGRRQGQHRRALHAGEADRPATTIPIVCASQPWTRSTTPSGHSTSSFPATGGTASTTWTGRRACAAAFRPAIPVHRGAGLNHDQPPDGFWGSGKVPDEAAGVFRGHHTMNRSYRLCSDSRSMDVQNRGQIGDRGTDTR
jgi:hypothetical protein